MRQAGFSLVELMIAVTLGLAITLAVSMTYLAGVGTQRDDSDVTRLNETARFAFDLIARELRKAGYRNTWQLNSQAQNFCATRTTSALDGLNDPTQINPTVASFTGNAFSIANKSDVLRVRFYGEGAGSGDSSIMDCHGYSVGQGQLVEETLFVAVDPATSEPSLYCNTANLAAPGGAATNRRAAMALVTGVESLQLLYGEDSNGDGVIDRYVPRQLVGSVDNVASVKISVVVRSPDDTNSSATSVPTFKHFSTTTNNSFSYDAVSNGDAGAVFGGSSASSAKPKRKRLMLSSEIALRNFGYCS